MRIVSKLASLAILAAVFTAPLLACELFQNLPNPTAIPTAAEPPTVVVTVPPPTVEDNATAPATVAATVPPTVPPTVVPTKPTADEPNNSADPAKDPCGLPGIQFRANFFTTTGANALTGPFSGDVTILKTAGGPNIFSIQEASVQRKFVILLPSLTNTVYDLKSTYMSYTEKTGANDKNPRIWKAVSGALEVAQCDGGGTMLHTVSTAAALGGDSALFQPLPGGHNTATGDLLIGVGAKIQ